MTSKGFKRLDSKIEREYKRKGMSTKRAAYIAKATAGKVAREKKARRAK